jgi:hypothetical protein
MLAAVLLNQDRNKVFVGLDLDVFVPAEMHVNHMLLLCWLRMRERETREHSRQVSAGYTIQVVDALACLPLREHPYQCEARHWK